MSFLPEPPVTAEAQALYDRDVEDDGYVMNLTRLWAHQPALQDALAALIGAAAEAAGLTMREKGVLVAACASTLGDSYCALAWGGRLAGETSPAVAAAVLSGNDAPLGPREQALAGWARKVAGDANGTHAADLEPLRSAGYGDAEIFAITAFVAARIAFSSVNDALGAVPDAPLRDTAPPEVQEAVSFGRR